MSKAHYTTGRRRSDHGQSIRVAPSFQKREVIVITRIEYRTCADPHALAMALRLAKLLEHERPVYGGWISPEDREAWMSDWLRDEVEKELGSSS